MPPVFTTRECRRSAAACCLYYARLNLHAGNRREARRWLDNAKAYGGYRSYCPPYPRPLSRLEA